MDYGLALPRGCVEDASAGHLDPASSETIILTDHTASTIDEVGLDKQVLSHGFCLSPRVSMLVRPGKKRANVSVYDP